MGKQRIRKLCGPTSSSRCMLNLPRATLSAIVGLREYHGLVDASTENGDLTTHVLPFVRIEKAPAAVSDDSINQPSTFAMTLLFDEQQAEE
ncbi:hypothetical protein PRIC1_014554 [Phytophthora ramorum]